MLYIVVMCWILTLQSPRSTRTDTLLHYTSLCLSKSEVQMVPPQTPAPGECWIVGDAPSGDWSGWAGALACWTHGGWRFVAPRPGMRVRVEEQGLDYFYDAGAWSKVALRPDGLSLEGVRIAVERKSGNAILDGGAVVANEERTVI